MQSSLDELSVMDSVQSICQIWKLLDLQSVQKELESTATELAARQDEGNEAKRRLVEQGREFKKTAEESIRKQVSPLLKSFQSEIDALSKRCKYAEGAFLSLYKRLIDIPDPVPVMEQALQLQRYALKIQDLDSENINLRQTLDKQSKELVNLRTNEATLKKLTEQLRECEERMETAAQARANSRERELQQIFAEKECELHQSQLAVAKKLGEAEHREATLKSELQDVKSELSNLRTKCDESNSAKADEMELIMSDMERVNERASTAERQVELLQQQLMMVNQSSGEDEHKQSDTDHTIDILERANLEMELMVKKKEISVLVEDVHRLQATINKMQESNAFQVARLEEEINTSSQMCRDLEHKLSSQKDYEEIKHELCLLKSTEFGSHDSNVDSNETRAADAPSTNAKSLESLLIEKNRSLQTANTLLKVSHEDLSLRYTKLQEEYNQVVRASHEQRALITQLEDDIRRVNAMSVMMRGDAEGQVCSSQGAEFVAKAVKDLDPSFSSTSDCVANDMLPIMQSQRERFRNKAQELEAQTVGMQQQILFLQNEMDRLRSDNLNLYERIRFLQSYPHRSGNTVDTPNSTESRYSSEYEAKIDPFSSFNRKERIRKYMNLNIYEKIMLGVSRFAIGNKVGRTVTFFYTICVHFLVFLVLYKMAYTSTCKRDLAAECHQKFAEHMIKVHGDPEWMD